MDASVEPSTDLDAARPDASSPRDPADPRDAGRNIPTRDAGLPRRDASTPVESPGPWKAAVPDGPVADCHVAGFAVPPARSSNWLAYRAQPAWDQPFAAYLVEVGEKGPSAPVYSAEVDPDWSVGEWSSDGLHFAHKIPNDKQGYVRGVRIATLDGSQAHFYTTPLGSFHGWAPTRSSFVLVASAMLQVYDGSNLAAGSRNAARVYGPIEQYFWSPDGRYYGILTPEAPEPGLRVLDLDAQVLALSSPFSSKGGYAKWSTDARYIAYVRATNNIPELWVVDSSNQFAVPQRVGTHVNNVNSALGNHTWLDDKRLLWEDINRKVHVTTVSDEALADYVMFTASRGYAVSPGGLCIAYEGLCGQVSEEGVCVREIREGASTQLVSHQRNVQFQWTDAGDRLMTSQYSGTVEVLNLDGQPFAPLLVRDAADVSYSGGASWAPGYPSRWIAYTAGLKEPTGSGAFLWHVNSGRTIELVLPPDLTSGGLQWSRDGHYIAIQTRTPDFPPARAPAVIQCVGEDDIGEQWEINGPLMPLSGFTSNHFSFQP